jgi:hypothetical protein
VERRSRGVLQHETQINNLRYIAAHCSPTAHFLSPFRLLPFAFGLLANPTVSIYNSDARAFSVAFTDAAAESASMGRGDFVSWTAFGSHTCNCPDAIWRDVVCD